MIDLVTIREYENANQARIAALVLQQHEIEYYIANETVVAMDWFLSNAVGGVRLQVPSNQAAQALAAIEESEKQGPSEENGGWIVFPCSRCKKPVALSAIHRGRLESCPLCNAYLDVPTVNHPEYSAEEIEATIARQVSKEGANVFSKWPRAMLILEVSLILVLLLPNCVMAFTIWQSEADEPLKTDWTRGAYFLIARSLIFGACIAAAIMLSKTKWSEIGFTLRRWKEDTLLGVGIAMAILLAYAMLVRPITVWIASQAGWIATSPCEIVHWPAAEWSSEYSLSLGLAFSALILNSMCEECMLRGFLLTRLERLGIPMLFGVIVSSTLFAFYYLHLGLSGAVCAWVTGIVFGIWFSKTRRLMAPIVAHTLLNVMSIYASLPPTP